MRVALTAAVVVLAAAGTTTVVPSLRALVEAHGGGAGAGGLFVAAHVIGQVLGAAVIGRRLARGGTLEARRLVVVALVASAGIIALMVPVAAAGDAIAALIALRAIDGVAHVAAIMGLLGAGAGEAERDREARLRLLGAFLVVGVGGGLGIGALLVGQPIEAPIAAAAAVTALAAALAVVAVPARIARAPRGTGPSRAPAPTVLAIAAERFAFGTLAVALPLAATGAAEARAIGATLGTMMVASIATLPLVAAAARRAGWRAVALASAIVFAAALVALALPGLVGSLAAGVPWAIVAGVAAAGIYAAALAAVSAIDDAPARTRAAGVVQAAGSAGHALGALSAGAVMSVGLGAADTGALLGGLAVAAAGVILRARG